MLCLVTSPNLFDTFGHISLFRCQEYWWSTGLRTLCAHPQRTNTIKTRQCAPLPIPRVQAVPASVTGEHRAKQLLPVYPASATTVISWNKARMQPHGSTGCSVTLQPLSLSLSLFLSTFSSYVNWMDIFLTFSIYHQQLLCLVFLCSHTSLYITSFTPTSHTYPVKQWCTQLVTKATAWVLPTDWSGGFE